jgi:hypothetical protein
MQHLNNKKIQLTESGNVFGDGAVKREYINGIVKKVQSELPSQITSVADIGSAGYKVESGDIDIFLDANDVMSYFKSADEKSAKKELEAFMKHKGYLAKTVGRNVHVEVPYNTPGGERRAQVDLMVIVDAKRVSDWHQHGPRGMYKDPDFKAAHLFILLNSIGKFLGLKTDAFAGKVMRRDDNTVVADNRADAAKILLNKDAKPSDLDSVKSILQALASDPDRDAKLSQARDDEAKGLIKLHESRRIGTAVWFRNLLDKI